MSVVVFGGDYLGGIEKNLYELGVTKLVHVSGRKPLDKNKNRLPRATDFVLVLTDFVNHNTVKTVKTIAKTQSIPVVYAKRSWRCIEDRLKDGRLLDTNKR